jgi:hypothetical protein
VPTYSRWSEATIAEDQRPSWQCLLAEQAGVVSVSQLRAYGHTADDIAANVKAGRWGHVLSRIYSTFTGDLPRQSKIHAALLYGGAEATLSHHTAAEEWRMIPIAERPVEITVPYTSSAVSQLPLVVVHRSRALQYTRLGTVPPRTKRTDTIVDLAVSQETRQAALNLVVDLVSQSAVSVPAMMECVRVRPPFRYRPTIDQALSLVRTGLMSTLEVEYQQQVERAHGLPSGDKQTPFIVDGKTLWEDVTYDGCGAEVTVRLDGRATHSVAGVAFRDRRRDNAAELAGRSRLVYGWHEVHNDPCAVAREVRAVLTRRGAVLPGPHTPCPACVGVVSA